MSDALRRKRHELDLSSEGLDQISAETKRLLRVLRATFECLQAERSKPLVDLNKVIWRAHPMLERLVGDRITIDLHCSTEVARIATTWPETERILIHLVTNARDAMPNGGSISIETENLELPDHAHHAWEIRAGRYVALRVRDTGVGMSNEIRERIFEPFFTTKTREDTVGLGLSMVKVFVMNLRGAIAVESEVGKGTSMTLYLPQAA